jgi:hypothetical protein
VSPLSVVSADVSAAAAKAATRATAAERTEAATTTPYLSSASAIAEFVTTQPLEPLLNDDSAERFATAPASAEGGSISVRGSVA